MYTHTHAQEESSTYDNLLLYFLKTFLSFNSLRDGNHTMFREFAFIRSTPHNRASFVCLFWKCFRLIGKKGGKDKMSFAHFKNFKMYMQMVVVIFLFDVNYRYLNMTFS